jgi:chromosome segregation ATPase
MKFVRLSHGRCDEIETASKAVASLKDDFSELQNRLAPFAAAKDGVTSRVKDLGEMRDKLAGNIEALQRTPQGALAERVQSFADDRKRLDDGVAQLNVQFSKLATLRADVDDLMGKLESALDIVATETPSGAKADVDSRIDEVSASLETALEHLEDIEDRLAVFGQLKTKLAELQSRLMPLESENGGVVSLIGEVQDIRDKLTAKIGRLEAGDNGDLAARVKTFTEAKRALEERVSVVTEHFSTLATVRKDLAGLFEKLSSAANTSSN